MKIEIMTVSGKPLILTSKLAKTEEDSGIFIEGYKLGWQGAVDEITKLLVEEEKKSRKNSKKVKSR